MSLLLLLHLLAAVVAPILVRLLGRWAFTALAIVPAVSFGWLVAQSARVTTGGTVKEIHEWIPALRLELTFGLSTLSWAIGLLVTGIGALVLFYCTFYFHDGDPTTGRFSCVLTAFAGAMFGLILADDLLLLYVFWELTTVFSYLLIGHHPTKKVNRSAAMQALLVTTFGGLAMLIGIVMIGVRAGTFRISAILTDAPTGTTVTIAIVLILVGAISKSALLPFHFWLPAAMAAPTPVSAYLHAAAMVKAGVYLVALFAPAYADSPGWRPIVLVLGLATMLLGGLRALRQHDIKLLTAYGTVSQLGFLITLVGVGTRSAALAGLAMVIAHALFKAALFLIVGVVDHNAGSRDLRELSGLWRSMPVVFIAAVLSCASMAAVIPLTGFVAKEAALAAFLEIANTGENTGMAGFVGYLTLAALVLGSILTVAYTARFLWGAFATKPDLELTQVKPVGPGFVFAPTLLAFSGLAIGFLGSLETQALRSYADQFPAGSHDEDLALWHGFSIPLLLSLVTLVAGLAMFWRRTAIGHLQQRLSLPLDATAAYQLTMRTIDRVAVEVTARTQRGSLSAHLGSILVVVVVLPGGAMITQGLWPASLRLWDSPAQLVVGVLMAGAAFLAARARGRLKSVVLAGFAGYGTAVLFMLHGAPDLALTQVLVETVTLVVFVLVLRHLPPYFTDRPLSRSRFWRMGIGVLVGLAVSGFTLMASAARTATPVSVGFPPEAVEFGGGKNIVNVTLVDIRSWDTMGEVSVLVVAATGIASLIFVLTRRTDIVVASAGPDHRPEEQRPTRRTWIRGGRTLSAERRSVIFEVITRLTFHTMIMFSLFLLFSGHNNPGGGFAGGLVAGLALVVRYLAGGRYELDDAVPVDAGLLLGLGLLLSAATGLTSVAFGGSVLQSAVIDLHLPLIGDVHLVTSLMFDIGVYLVVVGLMLDIVRSLGAGIDRQTEEGSAPTAKKENAVR